MAEAAAGVSPPLSSGQLVALAVNPDLISNLKFDISQGNALAVHQHEVGEAFFFAILLGRSGRRGRSIKMNEPSPSTNTKLVKPR